jgi:hypothetical protein
LDGESRQIFLDYVLVGQDHVTGGWEGVLLEVQGGGETSSTGAISRHVEEWSVDQNRTNEQLRAPIRKVGIIPNNAWKRQLEQVFRKAPLALAHGGKFALAMGEVLF